MRPVASVASPPPVVPKVTEPEKVFAPVNVLEEYAFGMVVEASMK